MCFSLSYREVDPKKAMAQRPAFPRPGTAAPSSSAPPSALGDLGMNVQRVVDSLHAIAYPKPVSARR